MNNFSKQRSVYTLLTSIKALDIYLEQNSTKDNITSNLTHIDNYINFIHNLYTLTIQQDLQSTVNQILSDYCNNRKSPIILKYIQRFQYIYNNYHYIKNYDYNYRLNIQRLAITKLYVINQINNKHGFYKVLRYLTNVNT
uniref:hypothetical protein n=1 Tax=Catenella fusiformis TaxID=3024791 RepID=UPI0027DA4D2D|nr:hypothetical protein REQ04_pgp009 [Catenella fusiformis]WCH57618.1 hypothetical protein [Catenella fusiformis]